MKKKEIIFVICPPVWEQLPLLGVAYLCEYAGLYGFLPSVYDMNIQIYNQSFPELKNIWTINTRMTDKNYFDYCVGQYAGLFEELIKNIEREKFKYAGFCLYKSNRYFAVNTAKLIKERFADIKIIFGGPEVFAMDLEKSETLNTADYFIVGEGEKPLLEILNGSNPKNSYKFSQLDKISVFPKYREFNLNMYIRRNSLPVLFSRGCINKCSFCSERLLFPGYRVREPESVFEELEYHARKNSIKWFTFYDSMMNGDMEKLETLMDLMIEKKLNIVWDSQISIRKDMSVKLMRKMKKAGCVNLFVGLETASKKILGAMNKNFTINEAESFLKDMYISGLQYEISLILDFPGETQTDYDETLEFLVQNRKIIKKIAQINGYKQYPGLALKNYHGINKIRTEKKIRILLDMADKLSLIHI